MSSWWIKAALIFWLVVTIVCGVIVCATQPKMPMPSPEDRDAIIKTVWGEVGTEPEKTQIAVINVIQNHLRRGYGTTYKECIERPHAFQGYKPDLEVPEDQYNAIGKMVDWVFESNIDLLGDPYITMFASEPIEDEYHHTVPIPGIDGIHFIEEIR